MKTNVSLSREIFSYICYKYLIYNLNAYKIYSLSSCDQALLFFKHMKFVVSVSSATVRRDNAMKIFPQIV